jgi:SOS response regulatory protein OraA/RecX
LSESELGKKIKAKIFENQGKVSFAFGIAPILDELKESFPLSAPYKQDELAFAESYIRTMRKWATENLGVEAFVECVQNDGEQKP